MRTVRGIRTKGDHRLVVAGTWDFDGTCARGGSRCPYPGQQTFSVACFQWVAKTTGKGLKRSKSVKRFAGRIGQEPEVFAKAEAFCVEQELKSAVGHHRVEVCTAEEKAEA